MKNFVSKTQKTGEIGENIACKYLENNGFKVIDRNYTRKWGEIDVVATRKNMLHLIEVKSVFCDDLDMEAIMIRPEENLHGRKLARLRKIIQTYFADKKMPNDRKWQFDLACVYIDKQNKKAKVKILENIIL